MVHHSAGCAHEYINSRLKLSGLVINRDSTVNCHNFELILVVTKFNDFIGNLECKLSRRHEDDGLDSSGSKESIASQVLYCWQTECNRLAWASEIPSNQVLSLVDWIEAMLLNREQSSVRGLVQDLDGLPVYLWEAWKLTVLWSDLDVWGWVCDAVYSFVAELIFLNDRFSSDCIKIRVLKNKKLDLFKFRLTFRCLTWLSRHSRLFWVEWLAVSFYAGTLDWHIFLFFSLRGNWCVSFVLIEKSRFALKFNFFGSEIVWHNNN